MSIDILPKRTEYVLAYAVPVQSYCEIGLAAQIDDTSIAGAIRAAAGTYLAKIPGLLELGSTSPSRQEMDKWLNEQGAALPLEAPGEQLPGKNCRTLSRFPLSDSFALVTLARNRMKHQTPELTELIDRYPRRKRVVIDGALLTELQQQIPEARRLTAAQLEQLKGRVVSFSNQSAHYLDWHKIDEERERQIGFYVGAAIDEYALDRQQEPAYIQERTRLINNRERLLLPLPE